MLRFLQTSDWHLGHTFHDLPPREGEHAAFLAWLRQTLRGCEADAQVSAGDLFDVAHPPPQAQRLWYEFLAVVWRDMPQLEVVVIACNRGSVARLAGRSAPRQSGREGGGHRGARQNMGYRT